MFIIPTKTTPHISKQEYSIGGMQGIQMEKKHLGTDPLKGLTNRTTNRSHQKSKINQTWEHQPPITTIT